MEVCNMNLMKNKYVINEIKKACDNLIGKRISNEYFEKAKEIIKDYGDPYKHLNGSHEKRVRGKALELFIKDLNVFNDGNGYTHDFELHGYKIEIKARSEQASFIPLKRFMMESKDAYFLVIFDVDDNHIVQGYDIYHVYFLLMQVEKGGDGSCFIVNYDKGTIVLVRGGGYYTSWVGVERMRWW